MRFHDTCVQLAYTHPINTLASTADVSALESLLMLLSKQTWASVQGAQEIAACLLAGYGDDPKVFTVWGSFARQSSPAALNFDAVWARETWDQARDRDSDCTLANLHTLARKDDPVGFLAYRAKHLLLPIVRVHAQHGDRGLGALAASAVRDTIKRTAGPVFYRFAEDLQAWIKCQRINDLWTPISQAIEDQLGDLEIHLMAKIREETDTAIKKQLERERDDVRDNIVYSRTAAGARHVVDFASSMLHEERFENKLDGVRHLLAVRNGVVDLRTGRLRQRAPEDMLFTILDVDYDTNADDSLIRETVLAAMADDPHMAEYLQTLLGYGITGDVSEEVFVVFTGSGRNAKGVLTQLLGKLMGSFYREMNPGIIVERPVQNIDAERGKLLGSRFAVFNELMPGEKLKTNEVQLLSGGDGIACRPLYKDPMTIDPRHLCLLCTNHMPELSEVIPAIAERLLCVHFPVTFVNLADGEEPTEFRRQADRSLKTRLMSNMTGVLKWLVDGAVAWYATQDLRRNAPAKVVEFSRKYLEEQDRLALFIKDHCEIGAGHSVSTAAFIEAFNTFLGVGKEQKERRNVSSKLLIPSMRLKGFDKRKNRVQEFIGLSLVPRHKS